MNRSLDLLFPARLLCLLAGVASIFATRAGAVPPEVGRAPLTYECTSRPLSEVLEELSARTGTPGVKLYAERGIGDQRVSFRVDSLPLDKVLDSLARLLSHSAERADGYRWYRREASGASTESPVPESRVLRRSTASRAAEARELELPRRRSVEIVTALRKAAISGHRPPARRPPWLRDHWFTGEWKLHLEALASLSDTQFEELLSEKRVMLDLDRTPEIRNARAAALSSSPPGILVPASLRLWRRDSNSDEPDRDGIYYLLLTIKQGGMNPGWNVYWEGTPNAYASLPDTRVDLESWLEGPGVTREMKGDVGYFLQGVARAAGLCFFQEHFYQPGGYGGLAQSLPDGYRSGSARDIVRHICEAFNYRIVHSNGVYFFWPHAWPMARKADIPEPELEAWRRLLRAQGSFSMEDRIRMALRYSQPQLAKTMRVALRQAGRWQLGPTQALRILGLLPPQLRQALEQGRPIPLEDLDHGELGKSLDLWLHPPSIPDAPSFTGGALVLVHRPPGRPNARPYLAVRLDDRLHWSTALLLEGPGAASAQHPGNGRDIDP